MQNTDYGLSLWNVFEPFSPWSPSASKAYQLVETDKNESVLYVSAPGYTRDDLTIEIHTGRLTIAGALPDERRKTRLISDRVEFQFTVNPDFQVEDAAFENGLLAVRLVRHHKAESSVKIPIRNAD